MVNSLISYQTRLMTRNYQRGWQILSKEMIRPMFRVVLKEEFILPKALINGLVKWIITGKTLQRRLLCLPVLSPPRSWILTSDSSLTLPIGEATSGFYNVLIPELWDSKANAVAKWLMPKELLLCHLLGPSIWRSAHDGTTGQERWT